MPSPRNKQYLVLSVVIFCVLLVSVLVVSIYQDSNSISRQKDSNGTKVAVIDSVKLKDTAKCFKSHEKTATMLKDVISRVRKSEQQVKSECEKIRSDATLSQKQKTKNIEKIEANLATVSSKYYTEIQDIKNLDINLSEYLEKKLNSIIESIAKSQKIGVVLNTQIKNTISVFYNTKSIDITDLVVQKLNEIVPDVNLEEIK